MQILSFQLQNALLCRKKLKALSQSHYSQGTGFASYSPATQDEQDYWTLEWWYKKKINYNKRNLKTTKMRSAF